MGSRNIPALFHLGYKHYYLRHGRALDGEELILMRLSDAIKETAPLKGLQTHRSWWVAEAGIKSVKKQDGKLSITLKNDATAPVSRNKAKIVREAGWV